MLTTCACDDTQGIDRYTFESRFKKKHYLNVKVKRVYGQFAIYKNKLLHFHKEEQ